MLKRGHWPLTSDGVGPPTGTPASMPGSWPAASEPGRPPTLPAPLLSWPSGQHTPTYLRKNQGNITPVSWQWASYLAIPVSLQLRGSTGSTVCNQTTLLCVVLCYYWVLHVLKPEIAVPWSARKLPSRDVQVSTLTPKVTCGLLKSL